MPRLLCEGLQFPTGVTTDGEILYVAESGMEPTGKPGLASVFRIANGAKEVLASGLRAPVTGLLFHDGFLIVSEGGRPGRISRIDISSGHRKTLLDDLPGGGDYHTNTPTFHDGWLYFGQGAATNAGVVSWDPVTMPWIEGADLPHDLPGYDIVLADQNGSGQSNAFQRFGNRVPAGTQVSAQLPCTSGVMRCRLDGSCLETVAWGIRNPFGLHALPDGQILVTDLGMNDRGARPVGQSQSAIWKLKRGVWYGHPDYVAGEPVDQEKFRSLRRGSKLSSMLLANHSELGPVPKPVTKFSPNEAPTQMVFDEVDQTLIVALFGDKRPITGVPGPRSGRDLARVNLDSGEVTHLNLQDLRRPIDLCWFGDELLVLDFGDYELEKGGRLQENAPSGSLRSYFRNELEIRSHIDERVAL